MHSMSLLSLVQVTLILMGVIFQIIALSWLYRDSSGERNDGEHTNRRDQTVSLSQPKWPGIEKPARPPSGRVHDYYEIEKTPPGVRPADLLKTARVTYVDNVNAPRPDEQA